MSETSVIASRFVDLALKHKWWAGVKLPSDEVQVFFEIISAAGFEPKAVVPGKLRGYYLEQDGSRTGETYPINNFCPYKVVSQEDNDHYFATGWLDYALRHAVSHKGEDRERLAEAIRREIERSVPLQPIQLTPEGDLLREYPLSVHGGRYFIDHTRDEYELSSCVGIHDNCDSWVDRARATKTHDAIICRGCHLRILFPKEIKTYGELRQALTSKFVQVPVPA